MKKLAAALVVVLGIVVVVGFVFRDDLTFADNSSSPSTARDPGPRPGAAAAGEPLAGLTAGELALFDAGKKEFEEEENVADGLGPTMNLGSCAGCHARPAARVRRKTCRWPSRPRRARPIRCPPSSRRRDRCGRSGS